MKMLSSDKTVLIIIVCTLIIPINSSLPILSNLAGWFFPKRVRAPETPTVTLLVNIPTSSVNYIKPLDVQAGGQFTLQTPMEQYAYSSAGRSNLKRVNIVYLMQSMYRPNQMCFFLHFWSMKDPTVPWNTRRLPRPAWARYDPPGK